MSRRVSLKLNENIYSKNQKNKFNEYSEKVVHLLRKYNICVTHFWNV